MPCARHSRGGIREGCPTAGGMAAAYSQQTFLSSCPQCRPDSFSFFVQGKSDIFYSSLEGLIQAAVWATRCARPKTMTGYEIVLEPQWLFVARILHTLGAKICFRMPGYARRCSGTAADDSLYRIVLQ